MSELAFAELETQVENLPLYQVIILRNKLNAIMARENERNSERMGDAEARAFFEQFSGCVKREIDFKKEREEWRDENMDILISATQDLEDGLQMACAKKYGLDYIITRNVKDFTNSAVQAIEPQEFLQLLNK